MSRQNNNSGCGTIIGIALIIGFISAYWPYILGLIAFIALAYAIYRVSINNRKKSHDSNVHTGNVVNSESDSLINEIPEEKKQVRSIDTMDGHDYEYFCADVLKHHGYDNVQVTRGSGDQGVDITAERDGIKYAVQCKRYSQAVGNKAVQEIYAGMRFYGCHVGIIMTNNYFTSSAKELAKRNGIILWDRDMLDKFDYSVSPCKESERQDNAHINAQENYYLEEMESEIHQYDELNKKIETHNNLYIEPVKAESHEKESKTVSNFDIHKQLSNTEEKNDMYDKEHGIYPAGTYLIGDDIETGKYLLTSRENLIAGVSIYESYSKYKKDEPLSYNSFQGDYHLSLREDGLFISVDNADMKRL